MSAISDLGISVDKAELIRALQYDRGQYVMGFQDGWRAANEKIVHCKDCEHFTAGYCCRDIKGRSQMHYMGEDAFCSYGERKNNE